MHVPTQSRGGLSLRVLGSQLGHKLSAVVACVVCYNGGELRGGERTEEGGEGGRERM